jgi:N-acetylglucosaminyl-diphospho-decaprenol L-rhamnosyltransferase
VEISFIIVNYQSEKYLQKCIFSIKEKVLGVDYEIIVVNNDSRGLENNLSSGVRLINNGKNLGFGAACNVGARVAQGEMLCFLNPDTEITSNNTFQIIEKFQQDKNLGAVGPRLIIENGKTQWWCAGRDVSFWQLLKNNLGIIESKKIWESEKELLADWVSGAALFARKDIFEKIEGFDERFFMYAEDMDLCRRIRGSGYKVLYCPEFLILHKGGKSRDNIFKQKLQFFRSSFYYLLKWSRD